MPSRCRSPNCITASCTIRADNGIGRLGLVRQPAAIRAHATIHHRPVYLRALPDEQRQVIELMYFGGLSQSKISDKLGLPLGTVKSRTLLGMKRLRTAIGGLPR